MNSSKDSPVVGRGRVPRRNFGSLYDNEKLPETVSILGLGCSSFSTFFWSAKDNALEDGSSWTPERLDRNHPRVLEWIDVIKEAVIEHGITLLDTAPWYGHGTSEVVLGWGLEHVLEQVSRSALTINTKVGRYQANPKEQFDFSYDATIESVQRSLRRMKCTYIDVLQLHDPEFAPSVDELLQQTIPAMIYCQQKGWCRALGMTGYPLEVQHEVLVRSMEQDVAWDQSLVYCHFNLHDTSLLSQSRFHDKSFADFCHSHSIAVLAAAPLSMGLLTHDNPPEWHPASDKLKQVCCEAAKICKSHGVNLSAIAILFAMSNPRIPCTILGMKDTKELRQAVELANRFAGAQGKDSQSLLDHVLNEKESEVYKALRNPQNGPFASVWESGEYMWDGLQQTKDFWRQLENDIEENN